MKIFCSIPIVACLVLPLLLQAQTAPSSRSYFHAKIDQTQGNLRHLDSVTANLQYAATDKIDSLQTAIEADTTLDNNNKIKFLRGLNDALIDCYNYVKGNIEEADLLPGLVDVFAKSISRTVNGVSIYEVVEHAPHETRVIISGNFAFTDNQGIREIKDGLVLDQLHAHPDKIIETLSKHPDLKGADSLIIILAHRDPETVYDYSAAKDALADVINNVNDPLVKIICRMAKLQTGRQFFPFLDDIYHDKLSFEQVDAAINDSSKYYSLMVQTAVDYANRIRLKDTPMAMQALARRMFFKAREVYVSTINDLHEAPDEVRFKIISKLSPEELYYLPILTEEEIYTSSYVKGVYPKIFQKLTRSDSLMMRVYFDHFRKWIKIAANFNTLDDFLRRMDKGNAELLMKAFVNGLDKQATLEDAVDVANSFGSINDPAVRKLILNQVQYNLQKAKAAGNIRGSNIYNILNILFLSMDTANHVDVSKLLGIPPVFYMPLSDLTDSSGRVIVEEFFYGDKDGNEGYDQFRSFFNTSDWKVTNNENWITVSSIHGTKVVIYANKPLDEKKNLDYMARQQMIDYLDSMGIEPTILIHRGHSYYLGETLEKLEPSDKIILLGSCGGYQSLQKVLNKCPEAHIVASKQTGSKTVNDPLIFGAMEMLRKGKDLNWLILWNALGKEKLNKELFDDYIPPYKNLGALFIMAYKKMGGT